MVMSTFRNHCRSGLTESARNKKAPDDVDVAQVMSVAISASGKGPALSWGAGFAGLSLEAEIRSLNMLAPETLSQLPTLFAESVVKSCSNALGESSGEALVRRIGDERLGDPGSAFKKIDSMLKGGSDDLKKSIRLSFRARVHRLYKSSITVHDPSQW